MRAAREFIDIIVELYGETLPGCTVLVRRSQADLAREFGCSAGTIAKWLRQLRPAVRVIGWGEIVVDLEALAELQVRAFSGGRGPGADWALGGAERRGLSADRAPAQTGKPPAQHAYSEVRAQSAPPGGADKLASSCLSGVGKKLAGRSNGAPSSDPRSTTTTRTERRSSDAEIATAVAPLVAYAQRCNLPAKLDAKGRLWLGLYTPGELANGVAEVIARLKGQRPGKPVGRPLGLLVSMAKAGDEEFFAGVAAPAPARVVVLDEAPPAPVEPLADRESVLASLRALRQAVPA